MRGGRMGVIHRGPGFLYPNPSTLNPKSRTINPKPLTLNPTPELDPESPALGIPHRKASILWAKRASALMTPLVIGFRA